MKKNKLPIAERRRLYRIFCVAGGVRLLLGVVITLMAGSLQSVSRDSLYYHMEGLELMELYALGENEWSHWIDEGWKQFIGLVYFMLGPNLIFVNIANALFAGAAATLLYRIGRLLTNEPAVAEASAYAFALFPSAVYFHSLPLKECAAVFAILNLLYGVLVLKSSRDSTAWFRIGVSLALVAALRVYLVTVLVGCIAISFLPLRLPRRLTGLVIPALALLMAVGGFYYTVQMLRINLTEYQALQYFDIDRLNYTRSGLSRGNAAMFDNAQDAQFGQGVINDVWLAGKGVFFFVFGVDIFNIRSTRQAMAVPEMLLLLYCLPALFAGVVGLWKRNPKLTMPLLLFTVVIIAVYGAATTNMGAMYRWRLQALPCLILLIMAGAFYLRRGFIYHFVRRFQRKPPSMRPMRQPRGIPHPSAP